MTHFAFNYGLLFFGASMSAWALVYAWWAHVRVTFLRQELFQIRDCLWDTARELKAFDDPAYRQAREHLNAAIAVAGTFSMQSLQMAADAYAGAQVSKPLVSDNPQINEAINKAREAAADTIMTYLLLRTATGILYVIRQILKSSFGASRQQMQRSD